MFIFSIPLFFISLCPIISASDWKATFKAYNFDTITKKLGYDPLITITAPAPGVEDGNEVTVYAHAWGDSKESVQYFRNNSLMFPGTIVSFNFKDAHKGSSLPSPQFSNFAQSGDIETLLAILKVLIECGVTKINLFGHSRGGGTILTMLARLYRCEYSRVIPDESISIFRKIGLTKKQATKILKAIEAGSIILDCPLVDTPQLIKEKLNWVNAGFLSELVSSWILPFFTQYRVYKDIPILSAYILKKHNFKIPLFIHFQKDDVIISTRNDYLLYEYLFGNNTYITIDNAGSHMSIDTQFGKDLQAFYKKHKNAYYADPTPDLKALEKAQPRLDELKKAFEDIQKYQRSGIIQYGDKEAMSEWQNELQKHDTTSLVTTLGYDPQIRVYESNDVHVENGDAVTVYVHGLGENAQTVIPYYKLNSFILPGTVVSFDFPDVIPGTFATNFKKLSLGQEDDIKVLASVLKILDECGLDIIHLFGTSRGGATIMNTLARFLKYEDNKKFFANIGILQQQADQIIEKIKKGTIILNVPLVDSNATAKSWGLFGHVALNYIFPRYTAHKKTEDQAINAAKTVQPKDFNILVHFEYKDEKVGNIADADFYKTIMGPKTYLVLADDGGHLHNGYTLGRAIQAFRRNYNGAYYNLPKLLKDGEELLVESPQEPELVDAFVKESYSNFEKLRRQQKR